MTQLMRALASCQGTYLEYLPREVCLLLSSFAAPRPPPLVRCNWFDLYQLTNLPRAHIEWVRRGHERTLRVVHPCAYYEHRSQVWDILRTDLYVKVGVVWVWAHHVSPVLWAGIDMDFPWRP